MRLLVGVVVDRQSADVERTLLTRRDGWAVPKRMMSLGDRSGFGSERHPLIAHHMLNHDMVLIVGLRADLHDPIAGPGTRDSPGNNLTDRGNPVTRPNRTGPLD